MTAYTLPRCAAPAGDRRWPMYFIHGDSADTTAPYFTAFLPERHGYRWATHAEVTVPHIVLDAGPVAQLLYLADINPATATDIDAIEAVDHALIDYACDMARVSGEVNGDLADHPGTCVRWNLCITLAARLCGVTP